MCSTIFGDRMYMKVSHMMSGVELTEQVSIFTHLMLYVPRKKRIFLGAPLPWQRIKMNQGTESFLIRG